MWVIAGAPESRDEPQLAAPWINCNGHCRAGNWLTSSSAVTHNGACHSGERLKGGGVLHNGAVAAGDVDAGGKLLAATWDLQHMTGKRLWARQKVLGAGSTAAKGMCRGPPTAVQCVPASLAIATTTPLRHPSPQQRVGQSWYSSPTNPISSFLINPHGQVSWNVSLAAEHACRVQGR